MRVAHANGGVQSMRALISVSAQERLELGIRMKEQPELAARITESIRYREQVLAEFERMAGGF